jgi:hypothetical protein
MRASLDASGFMLAPSPFDLLDPHLPHDDVADFTAMRAAFGLWFGLVFFHRADDEFAVASADGTVAGAVEAFEGSQARFKTHG